MKAAGIGIVGIGAYLPPKVRKNSDWSAETRAGFSQRKDQDIGSASREAMAQAAATQSGRIALEEMGKWKDDPFHGALERRVAEPGVLSSEMEVAAAKDALANAGIKPSEVDLLLVFSFLRDMAVPDNAGKVHAALGLPATTPAIEVGGICGSFLLQVQLAAPYLLSGGARNVLLVQSSLQSPIVDYADPLSLTFGDAATAVVLGRVAPDKGLLSCTTSVDGAYCGVAVLANERNAAWYTGGGQLLARSLDPARTKEMIFKVGELARESTDRALAEAQLTPADVSFFAGHQTIAAFSNICRRAAGLEHTKTVDSFRQVGSISACAIPLNLMIGAREGLLKSGDVAAVFTTGAGFNWSTAILKWGV